MFAKNGGIYTVHQKSDAKEPSDRIVLVREGFAVWAFVFNVLWLLYHRCWLMAVLYVVLLVTIDRAAHAFGLSQATEFVLQFGLQFWLGGAAYDCYRASLARKGYREIAVVCGESALLAERRYFDRMHRAV